MPGDVAGQHTRPSHIVALDDGIDHAVVVKPPRVVLKVDLDHSRPVPLLQKPFHAPGRLGPQWCAQEFLKFVTTQFGIRTPESFLGSPFSLPQSSSAKDPK